MGSQRKCIRIQGPEGIGAHCNHPVLLGGPHSEKPA
jgi:hypothetical protein